MNRTGAPVPSASKRPTGLKTGLRKSLNYRKSTDLKRIGTCAVSPTASGSCAGYAAADALMEIFGYRRVPADCKFRRRPIATLGSENGIE